MAQAHALLTAQMAEKIEKLAEMLEQLLQGSEEEVSVIRWRMLRLTHQLANDLEGLDNQAVMHQLHEQTQWLMRKSRDYDQQYVDVETSLESVGKTLEALHHRMKQMDQRLASMSTGLQALQQHVEQSSQASSLTPDTATVRNDVEMDEKKPVFELQFHLPTVDNSSETNQEEENLSAAEAIEETAIEPSALVQEMMVEEEVTAPEVELTDQNELPTSDLTTTAESELEVAAVELPKNEVVEEREEAPDTLEETAIEPEISSTSELLEETPPASTPAKSRPVSLRVTQFFDPRTLTLAERQKADNLKTAITLVEKFQLSKAFFQGDDSAFGQALNAMNKMQHLEEAEEYLAILAEQYHWDLADPQLLVLVKAVWRKLGVK